MFPLFTIFENQKLTLDSLFFNVLISSESFTFSCYLFNSHHHVHIFLLTEQIEGGSSVSSKNFGYITRSRCFNKLWLASFLQVSIDSSWYSSLIFWLELFIVLLSFSICLDVEDHPQGPVVTLPVEDGIGLLLVQLLISLFFIPKSLKV